MKKQYRIILMIVVLLIVTTSNYLRITETGNTRAVESLTSFVMGALTGILILQVAQLIKNRKNNVSN